MVSARIGPTGFPNWKCFSRRMAERIYWLWYQTVDGNSSVCLNFDYETDRDRDYDEMWSGFESVVKILVHEFRWTTSQIDGSEFPLRLKLDLLE